MNESGLGAISLLRCLRRIPRSAKDRMRCGVEAHRPCAGRVATVCMTSTCPVTFPEPRSVCIRQLASALPHRPSCRIGTRRRWRQLTSPVCPQIASGCDAKSPRKQMTNSVVTNFICKLTQLLRKPSSPIDIAIVKLEKPSVVASAKTNSTRSSKNRATVKYSRSQANVTAASQTNPYYEEGRRRSGPWPRPLSRPSDSWSSLTINCGDKADSQLLQVGRWDRFVVCHENAPKCAQWSRVACEQFQSRLSIVCMFRLQGPTILEEFIRR